MIPYWTILHGNVLERLREMPTESIHTCITSPPYWGLRSYGTPDQVWGGDSGHEHQWGDSILENATNHTDKRRWNHTRNGRDELQPAEKRVTRLRTPVEQGRYCECGAWCGSLGAEPTMALYIEHIVEVLREVRRVLRKDGTLWLNMGDSYARIGGEPGGGNRLLLHMEGTQKRMTSIPHGSSLKPKDLVGMPWRVALALQADGWYLRSDIIWSKPNPMPESVRDLVPDLGGVVVRCR